VRRRRFLTTVAAGSLVGGLAGCAGDATDSTPTPTAVPTDDDPGLADIPGDASYGFTFVRATGNRYVEGAGRVPEVDPVDVSLPAEARWVVAALDRSDETVVVASVLTDGKVRAFRVDGCEVGPVEPFSSYGQGPPLLVVDEGASRLARTGSVFSHPTPIPGGSIVVNNDGRITLPGGKLAVSAHADARIVTEGRLAYFLGPPTNYDHGALGDRVEGQQVTIVDPETRENWTLDPPYGVIEGLSPILTEIAGELDVLVTASDEERGASLALLRDDGSEGGTVVATSDPVGEPFGWRHQIAVAPFGPDGEIEIASVRRPHAAAEAEFHRLEGDRLARTASLGSYPSHEFGSRNLDRAAAGDFDGDGRPELLVPAPETGVLAGLRRTDDGVAEVWRVDAGAPLSSNVAATRGPEGVVLAVGTPGGLRIWPAAGRC
jgi:hypothetical protein